VRSVQSPYEQFCNSNQEKIYKSRINYKRYELHIGIKTYILFAGESDQKNNHYSKRYANYNIPHKHFLKRSTVFRKKADVLLLEYVTAAAWGKIYNL